MIDAAVSPSSPRGSQVDVAAYVGLNHATARVQLLLGAAHRF